MLSYKDYVNKVFTEKEHFLKDLFSILFVDIYTSIKDGVDVRDEEQIKAIATGFAHDVDLNNTLGRFTWSHFSLEALDNILKNSRSGPYWFSLLNLHSLFQKPAVARHPRVRAYKEILEKKYNLKQYEEFSNIAADIIRFRNTNAHNNGIRNSAQALALYAQINLILVIYPDELKEKVHGFEQYEKFINVDFKNSIDSISSSNSLNEEVKRESPEEILAPNHMELQNFPLTESLTSIELSTDDASQNIKHVRSRVENIESQLTQLGSAVSNSHTLIDSLHSLLTQPQGKNYQSTQDESALHQITTDDKVSVALNEEISEDLEDLVTDGLPIESQEDEIIIDDTVTLLTRSELIDNLLDIRNQIDTSMSAKYISFRNWHNILSRPLIDSLVNIRIISEEQFRNNETFLYYYHSGQVPKKVADTLSTSDLEALKLEAKSFMDEQLHDHWGQILSILDKRASPAQYANTEERKLEMNRVPDFLA